MNVKFLKGLSSSFVSLTKDSNTFYYVTDLNALYLGDKLIGNGVSLSDFNSLKDRVKSLEDWKDALPTYVTKEVYDDHLTAQAAIDKKQTEDIAQLRADLEGVVAEGGEPNKVDDVQVNGVSVVANKIANIVLGDLASKDLVDLGLGALASKDSIATGDIDDKAVTAAKLADAVNADIAKGVAAKTVTDTLGDLATKNEADLGLDKYMTIEAHNTFVGNNEALQSGITAAKVGQYDAVKATVDAFFANEASINEAYDTLQEIAAYLSGGEGDNVKDVVTRIAEIESDINTNRAAWEKDDNTTYSADESSIALSGTVFSVKDTYVDGRIDSKIAGVSEDIAKGVTAHGWGDHSVQGYLKAGDIANKADKSELSAYWTIEAHNTFVSGNDALQSGIDASKVAQIQAGVDAKAVTDTLKSAAFAETSAFDAAGAAAAVQGATTNTVKDCVDAINTMNGKTGAIIGDVENIVEHLTWGTF